MLNQKVVIAKSAGLWAEKEGIIVAESTVAKESDGSERKITVCKVLIDENISDWIPDCWLQVIKKYSKTA